MADDPRYAEKAARIASLHRDIAEVIGAQDLEVLDIKPPAEAVAVHIPCSQHHALGQPDAVPDILGRAGFKLAATSERHLCCGSAGTYSILQRERSERLRKRKLAALSQQKPAIIVTANVGCQLHLGEERRRPRAPLDRGTGRDNSPRRLMPDMDI